ncbi:putative metallopeptidase [Rouxiella badensis]|uniref:putative metallopeptidase n=1 Tax=Rouxiella badensis TaxID=1646377 RepID=UPI003B2885A2
MTDSIKRPMPPLDPAGRFHFYNRVFPAPEVLEWVNGQILDEDGPLYNEDHAHLIEADIKIMWASSAFEKQGRTVLGQAEQVAMRVGGWQKARMEQQMHEWFGEVPKFIITLAADYCSQCTDLEFCALVEHELYHIGQAKDEFGAPKFNKEGQPVLAMRGHDVEEFIGVVRRYGASVEVQEMIDAAKKKPEVAGIDIARACGTCLLRLA